MDPFSVVSGQLTVIHFITSWQARLKQRILFFNDILETVNPMNPTQTRILQYLKAHPAAAAVAISQALGMTAANIRYHLNSLEQGALIEVEVSPLAKGRGHPAYLYHVSIHAQQHNLDFLADILLAELMKEATPEASSPIVAQTLAERLIQKGSHLTALPKQNHLTQRLTSVVQWLDPFHYQARWEAHSGSPHFMFGQCPYLAIVDRHPVLCQMDAYLLEKLLARPVRQVARIGQASEASPVSTTCIFEIDLQRAAPA
jgi:predicted ArsR family transcriptional regulator